MVLVINAQKKFYHENTVNFRHPANMSWTFVSLLNISFVFVFVFAVVVVCGISVTFVFELFGCRGNSTLKQTHPELDNISIDVCVCVSVCKCLYINAALM